MDCPFLCGFVREPWIALACRTSILLSFHSMDVFVAVGLVLEKVLLEQVFSSSPSFVPTVPLC
jgi:hypothetical protein